MSYYVKRSLIHLFQEAKLDLSLPQMILHASIFMQQYMPIVNFRLLKISADQINSPLQ